MCIYTLEERMRNRYLDAVSLVGKDLSRPNEKSTRDSSGGIAYIKRSIQFVKQKYTIAMIMIEESLILLQCYRVWVSLFGIKLSRLLQKNLYKCPSIGPWYVWFVINIGLFQLAWRVSSPLAYCKAWFSNYAGMAWLPKWTEFSSKWVVK